MAVLLHAGDPNVSDQSDQRDNRQPALYWPGPQNTTPLMLMPATSPWFPSRPHLLCFPICRGARATVCFTCFFWQQNEPGVAHLSAFWTSSTAPMSCLMDSATIAASY